MRKSARIGVAIAVCAITIVGGASLIMPVAEARTPPNACECAAIDLPVICSNGRTYLNPCIASCQGATDCVPTGGGTP
jgi:hypothetical protein